MASYHCARLSTTIACSSIHIDNPVVNRQSSQLLKLCSANTSVSRATRSMLWVLGELKADQAQHLPSGHWYIELCPTYLASIDGVTRWSAGQAWKRFRQAVPWLEVPLAYAVGLGARIRPLKRGERWGRHILLSDQQRASMLKATVLARNSGLLAAFESDCVAHKAPVAAVPLPERLRASRGPSGRRTAAAQCPLTHNHKHADRSPSLVLWRNGASETGGAMCMSCRVTWGVRYTGAQALLYPTMKRRNTEPQLPQNTPLSEDRHNKNLLHTRSTPVGGFVGSKQASATYVGACLRTHVADGLATTRRSRGNAISGDPLSALQWSESRSKGSSAEDKAIVVGKLLGETPLNTQKHLVPTSVCSVSQMRASAWESAPWGTKPSKWEAHGQRWVLFDLDGVENIPTNKEQLTNAILRVVRRDSEVSGKAAIVQTGPVGLQIWVELREARHSPSHWFSTAEVGEWYRSLGERMLQATRRVGTSCGKVDMASCAPGRFGRRPGWRLLADGTVFRSSLLGVAQHEVAGRAPRHARP